MFSRWLVTNITSASRTVHCRKTHISCGDQLVICGLYLSYTGVKFRPSLYGKYINWQCKEPNAAVDTGNLYRNTENYMLKIFIYFLRLILSG
jgi:hypothetical protein